MYGGCARARARVRDCHVTRPIAVCPVVKRVPRDDETHASRGGKGARAARGSPGRERGERREQPRGTARRRRRVRGGEGNARASAVGQFVECFTVSGEQQSGSSGTSTENRLGVSYGANWLRRAPSLRPFSSVHPLVRSAAAAAAFLDFYTRRVAFTINGRESAFFLPSWLGEDARRYGGVYPECDSSLPGIFSAALTTERSRRGMGILLRRTRVDFSRRGVRRADSPAHTQLR